MLVMCVTLTLPLEFEVFNLSKDSFVHHNNLRTNQKPQIHVAYVKA